MPRDRVRRLARQPGGDRLRGFRQPPLPAQYVGQQFRGPGRRQRAAQGPAQQLCGSIEIPLAHQAFGEVAPGIAELGRQFGRTLECRLSLDRLVGLDVQGTEEVPSQTIVRFELRLRRT